MRAFLHLCIIVTPIEKILTENGGYRLSGKSDDNVAKESLSVDDASSASLEARLEPKLPNPSNKTNRYNYMISAYKGFIASHLSLKLG